MPPAGLLPHEGPHSRRSLVVVEALVSKDLTNEVLVSWHDLICLGVLSSMFPAVDAAHVRKVESEDSLREELFVDFPKVLSNYLSNDIGVNGDPMSIRFKEWVSFLPFRVTRCRQVPLHIRMRRTPCLRIWSRRECSAGWSATKQRTIISEAILSPSPGAREFG